MGSTTTKGFPYPVPSDTNDVPGDMQALAEAVDAMPGITAMSTTTRDALGSSAKWAGRVIWNTTNTRHERYDGSAWYAVPQLDSSGNLSITGSLTVTGPVDARVNINAQTGTAYTLVLGDAGKLVSITNASANTVTVPPNSSVAFPTGTRIDIEQGGTGQTTVAPGSGVTIGAYSSRTKLAGQYAAASLVKVGTDSWRLYGNLTS